MRYIETFVIIVVKVFYGIALFLLAFSASIETLIKLIAVGFAISMILDAYVGGRIIYVEIKQTLDQARLRSRFSQDSRLPKRQEEGSPLLRSKDGSR